MYKSVFKYLFLFASCLILTLSSCFGQSAENKNLREFEAFLGPDKSNALNKALESFDQFLELNYGEFKTKGERTEAFLKRVEAEIDIDTTWLVFNTNSNIEILDEWELTGLRKDIWLFSNEEYDTAYNVESLLNRPFIDPDSLPELGEIKIEFSEEDMELFKATDTTGFAKGEREREEIRKKYLWYNQEGKFLFALATYALEDSLVYKYVSAQSNVGYISPNWQAKTLREQSSDFDDPFLRRIIVSDFYFFMMRWDIKRNAKSD